MVRCGRKNFLNIFRKTIAFYLVRTYVRFMHFSSASPIELDSQVRLSAFPRVVGLVSQATSWGVHVRPLSGFGPGLVDSIVRSVEQVKDLSQAKVFDAVADVDRLIAWAESAKAKLVVAAVGEVSETLSESTRSSSRQITDVHACALAAHLHISSNAGMLLAEHSRMLLAALPETFEYLERGRISDFKARIISEGAASLHVRVGQPDFADENFVALMRRYEAFVLMRVSESSTSQLRKKIQRALALLAPIDAEQRHDIARQDRGIEMWETGDGMATIQANLPVLEAARVWNVLEYCAKNDASLHGSSRNRMADAFVTLIDGTSDLSPEKRNEVAEVQIVVGMDVLLGNSEMPADIFGTDLMLSAHQVRDLVLDSRLRRILVDPIDGTLLEFGRQTYRPPAALKDHIKRRDKVCRAPGCNRSAKFADVDHIVPWDDGGETKVSNLASLCRRHHLLKTFGGWSYALDEQGNASWKLPSGNQPVDHARPVTDSQTHMYTLSEEVVDRAIERLFNPVPL